MAQHNEVLVKMKSGSVQRLIDDLDQIGGDLKKDLTVGVEKAVKRIEDAAAINAPRRKSEPKRRPIGRQPHRSKYPDGSERRLPKALTGVPIPHLRDAFESDVSVSAGGGIRGEVGNFLPQAMVHEYGGVIAPGMAHKARRKESGAKATYRLIALERARHARNPMHDTTRMTSYQNQLIHITESAMTLKAWEETRFNVERDIQDAVDDTVSRFNARA